MTNQPRDEPAPTPQTSGGTHVIRDEWVTVANAVTLCRILAMPTLVCLVAAGAWGFAGALMLAVAATDALDGYLARRLDQVSSVGTIADRAADRLCVLTAGCTLAAVGLLPLWLAGLIVARDAVLLAVVAYSFHGPMAVPVTRTGKAATGLLLLGIPALLASRSSMPLAQVINAAALCIVAGGTVLYYVSAFQYARSARTAVRRRRATEQGADNS
jgi:cardiolipin synthase (CMP-forming)